MKRVLSWITCIILLTFTVAIINYFSKEKIYIEPHPVKLETIISKQDIFQTKEEEHAIRYYWKR